MIQKEIVLRELLFMGRAGPVLFGMFLIICPIVLISVTAYFWNKKKGQAAQARQATEQMCKAGIELQLWLECNGNDIRHPEAQALLKKLIAAEEWFAKTHSHIDQTHSIEYLRGLLVPESQQGNGVH